VARLLAAAAHPGAVRWDAFAPVLLDENFVARPDAAVLPAALRDELEISALVSDFAAERPQASPQPAPQHLTERRPLVAEPQEHPAVQARLARKDAAVLRASALMAQRRVSPVPPERQLQAQHPVSQRLVRAQEREQEREQENVRQLQEPPARAFLQDGPPVRPERHSAPRPVPPFSHLAMAQPRAAAPWPQALRQQPQEQQPDASQAASPQSPWLASQLLRPLPWPPAQENACGPVRRDRGRANSSASSSP